MRELSLYSCDLVTDVAPLRCLVHLTSLCLFGCRRITDLSPLEGCTALRKLYLNGCAPDVRVGALSQLPNLTGVTGLSCLDLSR
jgi:hypothetical protein